MRNYVVLLLSIFLTPLVSFSQESCHLILSLNSVDVELNRLESEALLSSQTLRDDMELFYAFKNPREEFQDKLFKSQAIIRIQALRELKPMSLEEIEDYSALILIANLEYVRKYNDNGQNPNSEMSDYVFQSRSEEVLKYILKVVDETLNPPEAEDKYAGLPSYLVAALSISESEGVVDDNNFPVLEPDDVFDADNIELLNKAMRHLSEYEKRVYILHHAYGLSESDISKRLHNGKDHYGHIAGVLSTAEQKIQDSVKVMMLSPDQIIQEFVAERIEEEQEKYKAKIDLMRSLVFEELGLNITGKDAIDMELDELARIRSLRTRLLDDLNALDKSEEIQVENVSELQDLVDMKLEELKVDFNAFIEELPNVSNISASSLERVRSRYNNLFK